MDTIAVKYGHASVVGHRLTGLGAVSTAHKVASDEIIGIEVEIENAGNAARVDGLNKVWGVKGDGSLRNDGYEFVSRPIPASAAPLALEYLMTKVLGEACCFSPRTSVHIHLNVQDLTPPQVMDYTILYSIFERLFYKFVGKGRMKNIYCVPLCDTNLLTSLVEFGEMRGERWSKYTGLNTLPIRQFGTVEFRHMHGTFNVGKLTTWISLITKLKAYVKLAGTTTIRTQVAAMNDGFPFEELLLAIFGEDAAALNYEKLEELNYLQAKQTITSTRTISRIRASVSKTASYFKVKD